MTDHRGLARYALDGIADASDDMRRAALASEATAYALLYAGEQLAAMVEQQRLANVIAAASGNPYDSQLVYAKDESAVVEYVRAAVRDIVNPGGDGR